VDPDDPRKNLMVEVLAVLHNRLRPMITPERGAA